MMGGTKCYGRGDMKDKREKKREEEIGWDGGTGSRMNVAHGPRSTVHCHR